MSDRPLKDEVLEELGEDRLREIAALLGTGADETRQVVGGSVASLTGVLTDDAVTPGGTAELCQAMEQAANATEPLPAAAAGFAGVQGGAQGGSNNGALVAVLAKVAVPAARAVAKRTGLPEKAVAGALESIIPVVAAVLARRAREKR
ncbi:DUF937 domain-containing protein [Streptomyces sp. NPDC046977]|uniref:DUF937 domain-containing protein n=1 Tax=Streptomyces sp. NPDC046977 TaxID=3154703 RepID=UPI0033C2E762